MSDPYKHTEEATASDDELEAALDPPMTPSFPPSTGFIPPAPTMSAPSSSTFAAPSHPSLPQDLSLIAELVRSHQVVGSFPPLSMTAAEKRRLVEESIRAKKAAAAAAAPAAQTRPEDSEVANMMPGAAQGGPAGEGAVKGTLGERVAVHEDGGEGGSDWSSEFESDVEEAAAVEASTARASARAATESGRNAAMTAEEHAVFKAQLNALVGEQNQDGNEGEDDAMSSASSGSASSSSSSASSASDSDADDDDDNADDDDPEGREFIFSSSPAPSPRRRPLPLGTRTIDMGVDDEDEPAAGPITSAHEAPLPPVKPPPVERLPEGAPLALAGEVVSWVKERGVEAWWAAKKAELVVVEEEGASGVGNEVVRVQRDEVGAQRDVRADQDQVEEGELPADIEGAATAATAASGSAPIMGQAAAAEEPHTALAATEVASEARGLSAPSSEAAEGVSVASAGAAAAGSAEAGSDTAPVAAGSGLSVDAAEKPAAPETAPLAATPAPGQSSRGTPRKRAAAPAGSPASAVPRFASSGTVVIRAMQSRPGQEGWLEQGSIVCTASGQVLGCVADTFGPLTSPFYSLRLPPPPFPYPDALALAPGARLHYPQNAPYRTFVDMVAARDPRFKGSDASNIFDEEVGDDELEWSDDEAEAEARRRKKTRRSDSMASNASARGGARGRGRGGAGAGAGAGARGGAAGSTHALPPRPHFDFDPQATMDLDGDAGSLYGGAPDDGYDGADAASVSDAGSTRSVRPEPLPYDIDEPAGDAALFRLAGPGAAASLSSYDDRGHGHGQRGRGGRGGDRGAAGRGGRGGRGGRNDRGRGGRSDEQGRGGGRGGHRDRGSGGVGGISPSTPFGLPPRPRTFDMSASFGRSGAAPGTSAEALLAGYEKPHTQAQDQALPQRMPQPVSRYVPPGAAPAPAAGSVPPQAYAQQPGVAINPHFNAGPPAPSAPAMPGMGVGPGPGYAPGHVPSPQQQAYEQQMAMQRQFQMQMMQMSMMHYGAGGWGGQGQGQGQGQGGAGGYGGGSG